MENKEKKIALTEERYSMAMDEIVGILKKYSMSFYTAEKILMGTIDWARGCKIDF